MILLDHHRLFKSFSFIFMLWSSLIHFQVDVNPELYQIWLWQCQYIQFSLKLVDPVCLMRFLSDFSFQLFDQTRTRTTFRSSATQSFDYPVCFIIWMCAWLSDLELFEALCCLLKHQSHFYMFVHTLALHYKCFTSELCFVWMFWLKSTKSAELTDIFRQLHVSGSQAECRFLFFLLFRSFFLKLSALSLWRQMTKES